MSQLITQVTMSAQVSMVNEVFLVLGWLCVLVIATLTMALPRIIPKRKSHSVAVKFNAITDVEKGATQKDVAAKYRISTGLINDWVKKKDKIQKAVKSGKNTTKRMSSSTFPKVEAAMLRWLQDVRERNGAINGVQLLERASEFAVLIPEESHFKASGGWLNGFMKRNDVIYRTLKGEANSVNLDDVEKFKTDTLVDVLQRYHVNDIFNCDEAGLQYGATSRKTLTFKGDTAHGTKVDKKKLLTILFCTNSLF